MRATELRRNASRRYATPALAAVLLAGLSACGGDDDPDTAAPPPAVTQSAAPTNLPPATTTLVPEKFANPFVAARTAAEHMPKTAGALASGFGKAAKAAGADTKAAEFAAQAQYLFAEYVYLSTLAMDIELVKPDDPKNVDAIEELDKTSVALADLVGQVATSAQRKEFLDGWRTATKALVDSAISNDAAVDEPARAELTAYPKRAAKLLGTISKGELDTDAWAEAFGTQLLALDAAHQAVKNKEDIAYRKLNQVAAGMSEVATTLAAALAEGGKLAGDTASDGAKLRASFSRLLTSHVYLALTAVLVDYSPPGVLEIESSSSVATAIGDNSTDITNAIGSLAPDFSLPFDQSWAAHINDVIAYSKAARESNADGQTRALASLEAYRTAAGKLLNEASKGELPANAVAKEFQTHIESLVGAVDALAKRMFS
ncbi:MAG: hypothetical protein ACT4QF_17050 [Sporichthyaceae bacterium]